MGFSVIDRQWHEVFDRERGNARQRALIITPFLQQATLKNLLGRGQGQMRLWDISIYSNEIRERVYNGILSNGVPYDEWSVGFF